MMIFLRRLLFSGLFALSLSITPGFADSDILIRHNGTLITPPAPPVIEAGRTLIPLRSAFEMVGLDAKWLAETQTAVGFHGEYQISIPVGSTEASVNGEPAELDVPARLIGDRVYVPLRFISETLGSEVTWDAKSRIVNVYTNHLRTKVFFKEPALKKALYEIVNKPETEDLTQADLIYLVNVDLSNRKITTLEEIDYLKNLKILNLENNLIRNLDPLAKLSKLEHLDVSDNAIEDIQPLARLSNLKTVDLKNNSVKSIQTLFRWSNLEKIELSGNRLDTPEELSPLYYMKDRITSDLNLENIEEPERNTWNLRSDISPYRLEVSPGLFWIPAVAMGPSLNENEDIPGLINNSPMGRASKIKTLYDLLQYLQHEEFKLSDSDKQVKDPDSQRNWIYTEPAYSTLDSHSGSPRALANAAAYLLSTDYRDSGILVIISKDGTETILNYLRDVRSTREEDENGEDITRFYTEYTLFNTQSYLPDSSTPAAPEDGTSSSYTSSGGIITNIHLTEDLMTYIKAYQPLDKTAVAYTISYAGNEKSFYPSSSYPEAAGSGSRTLFLPKSPVITDKDDDAYNSNPIESFYSVLYDDPSDKFSVRWIENTSASPVWSDEE